MVRVAFSEAALRKAFKSKANAAYKIGGEKYMKYNFVLLGVPAAERQKINKEFSKSLVSLTAAQIKKLFASIKSREREFLYFKIHVLASNLQIFESNKNLKILRDLLIEASWWDGVDTISGKVIHPLLLQLKPTERNNLLSKFSKDKNMWVRRSAIVSMVRIEDAVSEKTKRDVLEFNLGTDEFFINKAIGWFLREECFYNYKFVKAFCNNHALNRVAQREVDRVVAGRSQSGKVMKRKINS
jgi:3-methyladenine DNA glycosylase AlkD